MDSEKSSWQVWQTFKWPEVAERFGMFGQRPNHRACPMKNWFIELDYGKIYRKTLYLMVKTHGFPVNFPQQTNPVIDTAAPRWHLRWLLPISGLRSANEFATQNQESIAMQNKNLVGGFKHVDYFPCHMWDVILPSWRTHSFQDVFFNGPAREHTRTDLMCNAARHTAVVFADPQSWLSIDLIAGPNAPPHLYDVEVAVSAGTDASE